MGQADGAVIINIKADPTQAIKSVNRVEKSVTGLSESVKKLGKIFVAVFAVDKIVSFGKEAVNLGSSVAEVQNVVDVAFGNMAYKVEEFADSAIESFGLSQLAAKKTASTYMAMAKNMGLSMDVSSDMAITLAGLTGDVASFYNISQDLADIKLKSIFTGETETLKDLGIVMTQANLETFALEKGITKSISAMSQAELVTLRYNFVLDQLSIASGDFIRTQDSWANQTRILSMQWEEFMSIIGQGLIQVLLPVVRALNQIVSSLIDMANALSATLTAFFGGAQTEIAQTQSDVNGVSDGISNAVDNQDELTDATKETNKAQKKSLATFDQINKLSGKSVETGNNIQIGNAGITKPGGGLTEGEKEEPGIVAMFKQAAEEIKRIFQDIWNAIGGNVTEALGKISSAVDRMLDLFRNMWLDIANLGPPLAEWFNEDFIGFLQAFIDLCGTTLSGLADTFTMIFGSIWDTVIYPSVQKWVTDILPFLTQLATEVASSLEVLFSEVKRIFDKIWLEGVSPALNQLQQIWSDCWDSIIQAWEKWGKPIFDNIREAFKKTADTLINIWDTILKPIWDIFLSSIKTIWDEHLKPLFDNILNLIGTLINDLLRIYNEALLPIINFLVDTFGPLFVSVFDVISSVVTPLFGGIIDFISGIVTALTGLLDFVTGIFVGDWELAWQGLQEIATGVIDAITGAFSGFINGLFTLIENFVNFFVSGINLIIGALNSISFTVPDWVPLIGGKTLGFNIPDVPQVKLPRLAQGAVIPPNKEFLAVLGDQKSGTNIEAPTSEIEAAVARGMQRYGGGGSNTVILEIDKQVLGRVSYQATQSEVQRIGVNLVEG